MDCDIILIANGEHAIKLIESIDAGRDVRPDLIILDLNLPRRPGTEVLQSIRSSQKCRCVPVSILTSSNTQSDRDDAEEYGATCYLQKPLALADFLQLGAVFKEMLAGTRP